MPNADILLLANLIHASYEPQAALIHHILNRIKLPNEISLLHLGQLLNLCILDPNTIGLLHSLGVGNQCLPNDPGPLELLTQCRMVVFEAVFPQPLLEQESLIRQAQEFRLQGVEVSVGSDGRIGLGE